MANKHHGSIEAAQSAAEANKYFSVDARYHSIKNLPPDLRMKLRENLRQAQEQQQYQQQLMNQQRATNGPYQAPPPPSYNFPPAPPPPRPTEVKPRLQEQLQQHQQQTAAQAKSSLENSKQMSGSVSWLEWTQQLQAYIAWVNSQLRKRPDLRPVQDLRTDLQSGEVLAQLIEIICKLQYK